MKKQLIEKVNGEKQQYEALILKANNDILKFQLSYLQFLY